MKECIILAGGKGTRLGDYHKPKALIEINEKTIIEYRINYLIKQGISHFIIAVGHKKELIKEFLIEKYPNLEISFSEEEPEKLLGTAGAIKQAMKYVKGDKCFVTNVDDIADINIKKLEKLGTNTICLSRFKSPFGIVKFKGDIITKFIEKPLIENLWVSCGFYYLNKNVKLSSYGSIEHDFFPYTPLKAYKHKGYWHTINTLKDKEEVEKVL